MTDQIGSTNNGWGKATWRGLIGVTAAAVTLSTLTAVPAGAATGCGTYSYGFEGTRLLNDGISTSAGPFTIDLPAGVYTVTLVAHDHHSTQPDVPSQTGEQYHVVLDSGYVSPASNDIPDDVDTNTTVFSGQVMKQSNAISVEHAGAPGINSVNVICVGFTLEESAPKIVDSSAEDTPSMPADEAAAEPASEATAAVAPVGDLPAAGPTEPAGEIDRAVEVEVEGVVEIRDDAQARQDIGVPASVARPAAPVPQVAALEPDASDATTQVVQVAAAVVAQDTEPVTAPATEPANAEVTPPRLAITGPSADAFVLTGIALLLLSAGLVLLDRERRLRRNR